MFPTLGILMNTGLDLSVSAVCRRWSIQAGQALSRVAVPGAGVQDAGEYRKATAAKPQPAEGGGDPEESACWNRG